MSTMKIERVEDVRVGDRVTVRTRETEYQAAGDELTVTATENGYGTLGVLGIPLRFPYFDVGLEFVSATREVPDVVLPQDPHALIRWETQGGGVEYARLDDMGQWEHVTGSTEAVVELLKPAELAERIAECPGGNFTRMVPETELVEQRKEIAAHVYRLADRVASKWPMTAQEVYSFIAGPIERGEF